MQTVLTARRVAHEDNLVLALRSLIGPAVFLFHVLLAVALSFGFKFAEFATVELWSIVVLVVSVSIQLFLCGQADLIELAAWLRTLIWSRVCLFVLCEIAGSAEDFIAISKRTG